MAGRAACCSPGDGADNGKEPGAEAPGVAPGELTCIAESPHKRLLCHLFGVFTRLREPHRQPERPIRVELKECLHRAGIALPEAFYQPRLKNIMHRRIVSSGRIGCAKR